MNLEILVNSGIAVFFFLWLAVLTFFLFRTVRHYRSLTKGITKKDLETILNRLLSGLEKEEEEINKLKEEIHTLTKKGSFHLQKVGLVRFNPFEGTGGDQSFSLALLDEKNNGVVISSLYHREKVRVYCKPVEKGKGTKYDLSKEEEEAIEKAMRENF